MDSSAIADRRQLRRKLTFWRIGALLLAVAILCVAAALNWPATSVSDHVARVTISGVIQDDKELLERLDRIAKNSRGGLFSLAPGAIDLLRLFGVEGTGTGPVIEKLGGEKLFLDGLVSVWQVGRD